MVKEVIKHSEHSQLFNITTSITRMAKIYSVNLM